MQTSVAVPDVGNCCFHNARLWLSDDMAVCEWLETQNDRVGDQMCIVDGLREYRQALSPIT